MDGEDMTDWCRDADHCNALQPREWVCFAAQFVWNGPGDPWNHLAVRLARTSDDVMGDPDLFGLFSGGPRGLAVPNRTAEGYDFQDTSAAQRAVLVQKVAKATYGQDAGFEGVLLCVRAFGSHPVEFSLRAVRDVCPVGFDPGDGEEQLCSTRRDAAAEEVRYDSCTADGQCLCQGSFARPVPEVFPGLGFEDCAANVTDLNVTAASAGNDTSIRLEHQHVGEDTWQFYRFHVGPDDFQISLSIMEEGSTTGQLDLFLKAGVPPSTGVGQFDARPRWNMVEKDRQMEVVLDARPADDRRTAVLRPGAWFAGVLGGLRPSNFTILLNRYACPMGCSGHGTCDPGLPPAQRTCTCEEGYGGEDCSMASAVLEYGKSVERAPALFEYEFFKLPPITEAMLSGAAEITISASYYGLDLGHWVEVKPAILLAPANDTSFPTASAYAHKLVLDAQNVTQTLALCPSQLARGDWALAVYSPLRGFQIGYNLTILRHGRCLNACSGHGSCSEEGMCSCKKPWQGGDCSVTTGDACVEGSRRAANVSSEGNGTCWLQCRCEEDDHSCRYVDDDCVDYTCSPPARRAGMALECVVDECVKDEWVESSASICLRECVCPHGGGACVHTHRCVHEVRLHPSHHGPTVIGILLGAMMGVAGLAGYIHKRGVPIWLPMPVDYFGAGGTGLYQELSDA